MNEDPFADMPDADLARLVRNTMAMLGDTEDQKGIKRIAGTSAALFLIGAAVSSNGATLTLKMGGATVQGKNIGDWIVTVSRPNSDPDYDTLGEADVVLAGTLRPGAAKNAVDCFERLTVCRLHAEDKTDA